MAGLRKLVGGLGLLVIAILIAGTFWLYLTSLPLVESATEYLAKAVPTIARDWDRHALTSRMTPELRQDLSDKSLDSIYAVFTSFGPLTEYKTGSCGISLSALISERQIIASCTATARCANADVEFRLGLLRVADYWEIQSFFVRRIGSPPGNGVGFSAPDLHRGLGNLLDQLQLRGKTAQPAKPD